MSLCQNIIFKKERLPTGWKSDVLSISAMGTDVRQGEDTQANVKAQRERDARHFLAMTSVTIVRTQHLMLSHSCYIKFLQRISVPYVAAD